MKKSDTVIKLKEKLLKVKKKYVWLTHQLERERKNSASDAGLLDYQQIIEEKRITEKYIEKVKQQISENGENTSETKKGECIKPGCYVQIEGKESCLYFRLVKAVYSCEERQISVNSPIGKAVLGRRVGEQIKVQTPTGKKQFIIKEVS